MIERAGIDPSEVEDVIAGCVQQFGEQMFNVGRNAWLRGRPAGRGRPATTVDRQCGSAQQAVNFAAALIASGVHDVAIGVGVEHMGHIPVGAGGKWVMNERRLALAARAARSATTSSRRDLGGDDRRPVGDPPLRARRDRPALTSSSRQQATEEVASSARSMPVARSTATRT